MTIYIHIGNLKSGSTFLQKKVFPLIKNIHVKTYYNSKKLFKELDYIQTVSNLHFDNTKIKYLKKIEKLKKNKKILISSELFSGSINTQVIGTGILIDVIMKRIKRYFKNPKIILESIDKELIGAVAAKIKSFRKHDPYKGKGIRFVGERGRRKAGKTAAS